LRAKKKVNRLSTVRANLATEIRAAIAAAPGRERELARAAGVSNVALARIRQGTLLATSTIARKLAEALEHWGTVCQRAARRLRSAARRVPTSRTGRSS